MIVDIHGSIGGPTTDAGPQAHLTAYADAEVVDRILICNRDGAGNGASAADRHEPDINLECLKQSTSDPRFVPLYWARPGRTDSNLHAIAGALDTEPFAGLVIAPRQNGVALDDPRLDRLVQIAGRLEKCVFVLCGRDEAARPSRAYALARRFPRADFVLLQDGADPLWAEAAEALRRSVERDDASLFLDTAHATVEDVVAMAEEIGPDRLLFGSDAPCHGPSHARQVLKVLDGLKAALPQRSFNRIAGDNAMRLMMLN